MKKIIIRTAGLALVLALSSTAIHAKDLAKVNGRPITEKDLRLQLSALNEAQQDQLIKDPGSKKQLLQNVIDQEVMVLAAEKEKLDQTQDFKDAVNVYRKQYLANALIVKKLGSQLSDSASRGYYENNKTKYSTDQVRAFHILVSDEKEARELASEAKKPGADFQKLAEMKSKDPSVKNNRGDLGFFMRDRMVPEFADEAFKGKPGDIMGPVKTVYGYHVIKVVDRKPGKPMEYDEVELRVKNDLRTQLTKGLVSDLKRNTKVEIE